MVRVPAAGESVVRKSTGLVYLVRSVTRTTTGTLYHISLRPLTDGDFEKRLGETVADFEVVGD